MLRVMRLNGRTLGCWALVMALGGCGDSGSSSQSNSNSDSQGSESQGPGTGTGTEPTESGGTDSMSATEGNEGGMSDSISGTTGNEGGNSESNSQSGGSGNQTEGMSGSESSDTGMISGGGETSAGSSESGTTEAPVDCTEFLDEDACVDAGCLAVKGQQFVSDDAIYCLDSPVFLGCLEQQGCDDGTTTVCKGNVKYQLPNGCFPEGFMICQPPPDQGGNGYPEC